MKCTENRLLPPSFKTILGYVGSASAVLRRDMKSERGTRMSLPPHQATFTHSKRNKQKNRREFREMLVVESGYRSSDSRQDQAVLHPRRRLSARSARTDVGISVAALPCSGAQCISWAPARTSRDMVTPSRGALLHRACRRKEPFLPVAGYNRPLPRMFPLKKGRGGGVTRHYFTSSV